MGMLRVLSARGDDRKEWNNALALAGDTEAISAVKEAERIFAEQRTLGATAFIKEPGKPAQRIETFDPATEADIVMVPRVVGG